MNPEMRVYQTFPVEKETTLGEVELGSEDNISKTHERLGNKLGRPTLGTGFNLTQDRVISPPEGGGPPGESGNSPDWYVFQQGLVQAHTALTGGSYIRHYNKNPDGIQDVITSFNKGEFVDLGKWREENGYKTKGPHIAAFTGSMGFDVPLALQEDPDRTFVVFTTEELEKSEQARKLRDSGAVVVEAGEEEVDAGFAVNWLGENGLAGIVMMTTGPKTLNSLLEHDVLDFITLTEVQITYGKEGSVLLPELPDTFELKREYIQKDVKTHSGDIVDQKFKIYHHKRIAELLGE